LAGSEAAWQLAIRGVPVVLYEMRPHHMTGAHKTDGCAELVCSNSFRSDDSQGNAVGLLHEELRRSHSLIMHHADRNRVPAGGALAVDRDAFSDAITQSLMDHPLITLTREEVRSISEKSEDYSFTIIATGPLTSFELTQDIIRLTGEKNLAFFDAISPIIHAHSIDTSKTWFQSRYDKGETEDEQRAYLNCPLSRDEYENFISSLLAAPTVEFQPWEEKETSWFEGCLPIEIMAARGIETLRHGPMKPRGLTNPHKPDQKPWAVIQLRCENTLGTLFNIVGFQTKMTHSAQLETFRTIPGLEKAEFARLGGVHRNTFINARNLLNPYLHLKKHPNIQFAGQITGVEGYVESTAIGMLAGIFTAEELQKKTSAYPPQETAIGSLLAHITCNADEKTFQPMNVNFGLFPALPSEYTHKRTAKKQRAAAYCQRALEAHATWIAAQPTVIQPL
jgi:methylenetetrahydrofolate--tRNA-(uracil-5-)-methyltransferase